MEPLQQKLTLQNRLDLYKHIDLTDDELTEAIYQAKYKKDGEINRANYAKKLDALENIPAIKYNDVQLLKVIEEKCKINYGHSLNIDDLNDSIIQELCVYFSNMPDPLDLSKGIALFGNVGCGKTTLMRLYSENQKGSYTVISCRKVAQEFANGGEDGKGGFKAIEKYFNLIPIARNNFHQTHLGICFDDLGTESEKKNFGNQLNVMAEILLNRYDNNLLKGMTHITTNLSADEIEQFYGTRVRSRMREMFNVIRFPETAKDRRV